uniref:hypothetical protein n=1 Tax=Paractinoplanes polyasparticus TaxID=2856853 RepID=UPI001C86533A|nr:hypothetical protein [Actinoplanes polyasparticus]
MTTKVPAGVDITPQARMPVEDPTLGIDVPVDRSGSPPHRLVTIGDSLFHGFQSGAVYQTDLSAPAVVAHELGWLDQFRRPQYSGPGGLPFNAELLFRELERRHGPSLNPLEVPLALFTARQWMDVLEDYWERGPGSPVPQSTGIPHNLAMYGWDLRDALDQTVDGFLARIQAPTDGFVKQGVENHTERAALRLYPTLPVAGRGRTVFDLAAELGDEGGEHGIETLVVFLGSNNALRSVVDLEVRWSGEGYDDLDRKGDYTVWHPEHFRSELAEVDQRVRGIKARHVIWCTVPHVTIAPICHGVGSKVEPGSRYYPYYTRPWISDRAFDQRRHPHITAEQARAVDSAIDQYNEAITALVWDARKEGADWYLLDLAGVLDRLADRRYAEDPNARPSWWTPYPMPNGLAALDPPLTSGFLTADGRGGRAGGGLFSLDGVHPTTVGYGIIAQELIRVMRRAGVVFHRPDGSVRPDPVTVDFARLLRRDTLVSHPPQNVGSGLKVLAWAEEALNLVGRTLPL